MDLEIGDLRLVLDTEHAEFAAGPVPLDVSLGGADATVGFKRPGAVILQER